MKTRLSGRLSPEAKKRFLTAAEEPVSALLQVAPTADLPALRASLEAAGGRLGSWMEETRLLSVEIAAGRLEEVADLPGVAYVDAATAWRR
jgi:hypothetical protein